ncbi:MAG TPA: 6-phosphogluconolactonase [Rhizobiales bacterium]|nr:6-phosphogluconolactonase [Hyphomicrobiales bacterium]
MNAAAHLAWRVFTSPETLAQTLADTVAAALDAAIVQRGRAFLALSGGTTPKRFLAALSRRDLDWSRMTVTLVDERFVPEDSPRSNAALVRATLLTGTAAAARFIPLYRPAADVETAARLADATLASLPWPLDVAVLGMGADGHTASFFPDATDTAAFDPAGCATVVAVHAESAAEPRLTLTLPRLASARFIALHIEGREKRRVLQQALSGASELPVRKIFDNAEHPVQIFWAP